MHVSKLQQKTHCFYFENTSCLAEFTFLFIYLFLFHGYLLLPCFSILIEKTTTFSSKNSYFLVVVNACIQARNAKKRSFFLIFPQKIFLFLVISA